MPGLLIPTSPCKRDPVSYFKTTPNRASQSPSPTPSPPPTVHSRRTLAHTLRRSSSRSPPPPISGLEISVAGLQTTGSTPASMPTKPVTEFQIPETGSSDAECWSRMLALQREYHCYNSARLEAAVEALEMGWGEDAVQIPSRLCLDLLNEELHEKMRVWSVC